MGLWRWLLSPRHTDSVTDYEQLFRSNEENIRLTARSIRISKRRVREVRRTLLQVSGAAFALLCAAEYTRKPRRLTNAFLAEIVAVFALFPVIVYSAKRSIEWFFLRRIAHLEERLQELKAVQDDKIAEFKKFTNFSKLRELVSKYDDADQINLSAETEPEPPQNVISPGNLSVGGTDLSGARSGYEDVAKFRRQRTLVDRVCDYLLADGPSNRYALICQFCYTHNGLVVREDFDLIRYVCCCCGQLNCRADQAQPPPQIAAGAELDRQTSDSTIECRADETASSSTACQPAAQSCPVSPSTRSSS